MTLSSSIGSTLTLLIAGVGLLAPPVARAATCEVTPKLNEAARAVMKDRGLIEEGSEDLYDGRIGSRWTLSKAKEVNGVCLLVMDLCTIYDADTTCEGAALEVLAYSKSGMVKLFEEVVAAPSTLKVAIGQGVIRQENGKVVDVNDNFYVEFSGRSAIEAWKSILIQSFAKPTPGLGATISAKNVSDRIWGESPEPRRYGEPDGAAPFDPTPGRKWKLKDASWSLRRGASPEGGTRPLILDVYPGQLDEDFLAFYSGSGGVVAPWTALLIQWFNPATRAWEETGVRQYLRELYSRPVTP